MHPDADSPEILISPALLLSSLASLISEEATVPMCF